MFICGENAVRKRQNMVRRWRNGDALQRVDAWFTAFWFQKTAKTYEVAAVTWCNAAVATLKSAKSCAFEAKAMCDCGDFNMLFK